MKIVDAFLFYNELDLLYYRLSILYDVVDHFIISESTRTFRGHEKPLFYLENQERFKKFQDKIIHVVDRDFIAEPDISKNEQWYNENSQRIAIDVGIRQLNLAPEDLIMVCDLDEIPNPAVLRTLKPGQITFSAFIMDFYYYTLTCKNDKKLIIADIVCYDYYKNKMGSNPQHCRGTNDWKQNPYSHHPQGFIENGGWHLSYFGDVAFVQNKIKHFAHAEVDGLGPKEILSRMNRKVDLFNRSHEPFRYIAIADNKNLPPEYETYLSAYIE